MRPYPREVRERVIQLLAAGWSTGQVAASTGVSARTVCRYRLRAQQGQLAPLPIPGRAPRIPPAVAEALSQYVRHHPHTTLAELQTWLVATSGIQVSVPTVSRTLHKLGFRRLRRPNPPAHH